MIFTRRSEWDYSWLKDSPAEVSLCHRYEHARYALLHAAPDSRFVFPKDLPFGAIPHLFSPKPNMGPIFYLATCLPEKVKFPQMTYREARKLFTFDPERLVATIEEFCTAERPTLEKLEFYLRLSLSEKDLDLPAHLKANPPVPLLGAIEKAQAVLTQLKSQPPPPLPKRGAGARIRQERTALKCLAAAKLLDSMKALKAITHTAETLGRPLFNNESEWSRARKRARKALEPYHAEANILCQALSEKRTLKSLTYLGGKLQIDWA
jgi:hypothetical protein